MDRIIRNFYIGDEEDSRNLELLRKNKIRCIVNCTKNVPNHFPGIFWYFNIPLEDPDPNISNYFGAILNQFSLMQNFPVLVHCRVGKSRSVTALTYFLSSVLDLPWEFVVEKIKEARPIAEPHIIFQQILSKHCKCLC